jgi:hypothetical protein
MRLYKFIRVTYSQPLSEPPVNRVFTFQQWLASHGPSFPTLKEKEKDTSHKCGNHPTERKHNIFFSAEMKFFCGGCLL